MQLILIVARMNNTHEIETIEGAISADEIIPYVTCGKYYVGEEHNVGNVLYNIGASTFVLQVKGIPSNLTIGGEEHDEGSLVFNLCATTFVVHV